MTLEALAARLAAVAAAERFAADRLDGDALLVGRVAVLSSAFNPPTRAHAALLAVAGGVPGVTGTAALLTTRNVDKGIFGASLEHRAAMLVALTREGHAGAVLAANAARFADQGPALRAAFPGVAFDFIAGYDTLVRIFEPKYYAGEAAMHTDLEVFFAHHRLIVTNRGEASLAAVEAFLATAAARSFADRIVPRALHDEPAAMSSTRARERAAAGEHQELVTPAVAGYISAHGLYR